MKKLIFLTLLIVPCSLLVAQRPTELRSENILESLITHVTVTPGSNVSQAFQDSLQNNYVAGNTTNYLQFDIPKGTYEVENITESAIFKISDKNNVIINGNGSTIIGKKLLRFFECNNSENVILKNFDVDHDPLPFSQGTVQEVNTSSNYINVTLDAGYDNPVTNTNYQLPEDGGNNTKLWLFIKDPTVRGMMKKGCNNVYVINKNKKWVTDPDNSNQIRIWLSSMTNIAVGDKWCMPISSAKNLIRINNSEQVTVEDVNQYSGAGALMYGKGSSMLNFIRVKSILKPNTDRIQGNTRDGAIFSTNSIGPMFEDCVIEANGDDGINMNIENNVLEAIDVPNGELTIKSIMNRFGSTGEISMIPGDTIVFFQYGEEKEYHRDVVDALTTTVDSEGIKHAVCEMQNTIPSDLMSHGEIKVWNISKANPNFIIKGCKFRFLRRHAIFLYGRNGIIENNTFDRNTGKAIEVLSQGRLGYLPENVKIRNNTFTDNNISQMHYGSDEGAPFIFNLTSNSNDDGSNTNANKPITNIAITNNTFDEDYNNTTIFMTNCKESNITNNTFQSYNFPLSSVQSKAVKIEDADVTYSAANNTFTKKYFADAQILRFNSTLNSNTAGTHSNEVSAGHTYHSLNIDASGNISIPDFGEKSYHLPDSIAKQVLADNPRTIHVRFKFAQDVSLSNTTGPNLFTYGENTEGNYMKLHINPSKKIVLDLGNNVKFKTATLTKDFSTHTKIELSIDEDDSVNLKMDDNSVAWDVTPTSYDINTSPSDFELFTNNSQQNGVTLYSFRVWNYDKNSTTAAKAQSKTNDISLDEEISIYPNPMQSHLIINQIDGQLKHFEIINMMGQVVSKGDLNPESTQSKLDCSGLYSGTYILRLHKKDGIVENYKVLKK